MTNQEFLLSMARLEVMFNRGTELAPAVRSEYHSVFRYCAAEDFRAAVDLVIKSFRASFDEKFPSVALLISTVVAIREANASASMRQTEEPPEDQFGYCQACRNSGLVLGDDNVARPCVCPKGRVMTASLRVNLSDPDRASKIDSILAELPFSAGPVRGLREKGPDGMWRDTDEEHGRKISAARFRNAAYERLRTGRGGSPLAPTVGRVLDGVERVVRPSGKDAAAGVEQD
jgi:hypothetical protein